MLAEETLAPSVEARNRKKIKVLFVEDHQVLREALIVMLESSGEVVVTGTASSAEEAVTMVHQEVDLVILDLTLPGKDGAWLTRQIKKRRPDLPVLVLTMHDEPVFVVKALESGVDGYLTKWAGEEELRRAIHSLIENGSYLQSRVAPLVVEALRARRTRQSQGFSPRERKLGTWLTKGLSNSEMAARLSVSVSTVKMELRCLYSKVGASCRTEAVALLVEKKIFSPS